MANHEQVSYRTINRFQSQETTEYLLAEALVLFRRQLITNQVFDNEALFIDGKKIEADANKFSFVWCKATNRYEAVLDKQSNEFHQTLYKEEKQSDKLTSNQLEELAHHLETEFVATKEQLQNEKEIELFLFNWTIGVS